MKKTLALFAALLMMVALLAACGSDGDTGDTGGGADNSAASQDAGDDDGGGDAEPYNQDFEFTNSTDQTIVEMRASAGGSDEWRDNFFEGMELAPGETVVISLAITPGDTTDFRVVAENGAEHELRGYELENFSVMELMANEDGSAVIVLS